MSDSVREAIAKILMAKSYEEIPAMRGMYTREMADLLDLPITTINNALTDQTRSAMFGIYKLTPGRQRYVRWAYSKDVAEKANGLPFNSTAGIAPEVQAAEVNKLVAACVDPEEHTKLKMITDALEEIVAKYGLSVARGDVLGMALTLVDNYYKEQSNGTDEEV